MRQHYDTKGQLTDNKGYQYHRGWNLQPKPVITNRNYAYEEHENFNRVRQSAPAKP